MPQQTAIEIGGRSYHVEVEGGSYVVNGNPVSIDEIAVDNACGLSFRSDSVLHQAVFDRGTNESYLLFHGREFPMEFETERDRLLKQFAGNQRKEHHHAEIRALMPGLIVRIVVEQGQNVSKGDPVLILEAMKMENEIRATADGIVKDIRFQKGQAVEKGDLLIVLD